MNHIRRLGTRYVMEIDTTVEVGEIDTTVKLDIAENLTDILDVIAHEAPEQLGATMAEADVDPDVMIGYIRRMKRMIGTWEHQVKPKLMEAITS